MLIEDGAKNAHRKDNEKALGHLEKKYAGGSRVQCSTKTQ